MPNTNEGMLGASGEHRAAPKRAGGDTTGSQGSAMKRIKLLNEIPPVQNGFTSASKTPEIDEGRVADIPIEMTEDVGLFFNEDVKGINDIPDYEVSNSVQRALKGTWQREKTLRDAVYTDLLMNQGVEFPTSSLKQENPSRFSLALRGAFPKKNKVYQEATLANLLSEFARDLNYTTTHTSMQRIVQGLPVTTTSEPDLAPLDTRGDTTQIRLGEFKNASNYNVAKAKVQCTMYLLGLLYWLRVELGTPVESVFGFYFCGRRCEDQNKKGTYTVGFLRLSAARFLGDNMEVDCFELKRRASDLLPMRLLIHFLKKGKRWDVPSSDPVPVTRRIPSLFTLPFSLWQDESDERRLILHGTLSIVFVITPAGLENLLSEDSVHFKSLRTKPLWKDFCNKVLSLANSVPEGTRFFLKIRSRDTSSQRCPMAAMDDVWDVLVETEDRANDDDHQVARRSISSTYPLRPYTSENIGVVLMHDRGCPLKSITKVPVSIIAEFQNVMKMALFLSTCLPHGDALPHNLVVDPVSNEMTLIDVDEGVRKAKGRMDHILQRKNVYNNDSNDWYIALMYPNTLRRYGESYTKCQLIASFLYLMTIIDNLTSTALKQFGILHGNAEVLGGRLFHVDIEGEETSDASEYVSSVNGLYEDMERLVDSMIADAGP